MNWKALDCICVGSKCKHISMLSQRMNKKLKDSVIWNKFVVSTTAKVPLMNDNWEAEKLRLHFFREHINKDAAWCVMYSDESTFSKFVDVAKVMYVEWFSWTTFRFLTMKIVKHPPFYITKGALPEQWENLCNATQTAGAESATAHEPTQHLDLQYPAVRRYPSKIGFTKLVTELS